MHTASPKSDCHIHTALLPPKTAPSPPKPTAPETLQNADDHDLVLHIDALTSVIDYWETQHPSPSHESSAAGAAEASATADVTPEGITTTKDERGNGTGAVDADDSTPLVDQN